MNGQADEFCLVEPLVSTDDDIVERLGLSHGIERIAFGERKSRMRAAKFWRFFFVFEASCLSLSEIFC